MSAPVFISRECDDCGTGFRFTTTKSANGSISRCYACANRDAHPELLDIASSLYAVISQAIKVRG